MSQICNDTKQKGIAMFVCLIMLLLMTMIIIHGARSSTLEIFMANNMQSVAQALMRAEDSALDGENLIEANYPGAPNFDFAADDDDGWYVDVEIDVESVHWDEYVIERTGEGPYLREYVVEYIGSVAAMEGTLAMGAGSSADKRFLYRVSGRGASNRGSTRVVQTIYATKE